MITFARTLAACALLAGIHGVAHSAPVLIGPWQQTMAAGSVTVEWETADADAEVVTVELPAGEKRSELSSGTRHSVTFRDLPAGRFKYRIQQAERDVPTGPTLATGTLAAAPASDRPFTFLVYGDNRDRDADHARVIAAMRAHTADLLLHTGDMTGEGGQESLWRRFFDIEAPLLADVPIFPALGNHEYFRDPTASHFHRFFQAPAPSGGPPGEARWYAFTFGNARFIALDANHSRDRDQHAFLERELASARPNGARHVFVFFHQPPFSDGGVCGSAAEQGLWVPEFEHHMVTAVFTGHDHAYERLERHGIRYFVTGGGGAPLYHPSPSCPAYDVRALKRFESQNHFLEVRVRGADATLEVVAANGELLDRVVLSEPAPVEPAPPVPFLDPPPHEEQAMMQAPPVTRAMVPPVPAAAPSGIVEPERVPWLGVALLVTLLLVGGLLAWAFVVRRRS